MSKLCTLQNKANEVVRESKNSNHVTPYYFDINIPKLQDLYKHKVDEITFWFSIGNQSPFLTPQPIFLDIENISGNTRSSTNVYIHYKP